MRTGATASAAPLQSTQIVMPAALNAPDMAVASYAEQIRSARARAALAGAAAAEHAIGAKCVAVYSADGQWYSATVESVTPSGNFVVRFDGYNNEEEVSGLACVMAKQQYTVCMLGVMQRNYNMNAVARCDVTRHCCLLLMPLHVFN